MALAWSICNKNVWLLVIGDITSPPSGVCCFYSCDRCSSALNEGQPAACLKEGTNTKKKFKNNMGPRESLHTISVRWTSQ